jgi:hypothetical protein
MKKRGLQDFLEQVHGIPKNISRVKVTSDGLCSFTTNDHCRKVAKLSDENVDLIRKADEALAKGQLPEDHVQAYTASATFQYSHRVMPRTDDQKKADREYRKEHPSKKRKPSDPLARIKQAWGEDRVRELTELAQKEV